MAGSHEGTEVAAEAEDAQREKVGIYHSVIQTQHLINTRCHKVYLPLTLFYYTIAFRSTRIPKVNYDDVEKRIKIRQQTRLR